MRCESRSGSNKEIGYVVIPLFLERKSGETLEEALERSDFVDVVDVLNAMQEQDEDPRSNYSRLQEAKGRGEIFDPRRLSEKIEVLGPSIDLSALHSNIYAEIVDAIGIIWDEWYGRLQTYREHEGHCNVPTYYEANGYRLGRWVSTQRRLRGLISKRRRPLSDDRQRRLDKLGFVWDLDEAAWEEGFSHLKIYTDREGHCRVSPNHIENDFQLGQWVRVQREREGERPGSRSRLSENRRRRLDELGFVWDPLEVAWEKGFEYLRLYRDREGHCRVPRFHTEDKFRLGMWVAGQRKSPPSEDRRDRLNHLGFVWNPLEDAWEEGINHLKIYRDREGDCLVNSTHKEEGGFFLGKWVSKQRQNIGDLSEERRQKLMELGFVWDPLDARWDESFRLLTIFKERKGHCDAPSHHKENGFSLGQWVVAQRRKKDSLSEDRKQKLDALGFRWDPKFEANWERSFKYLVKFQLREGHCRVPDGYIEDGFKLGTWVAVQRRNRNLPEQRRKRLDELGFVWNPYESAWEEGVRYLTIFKQREGHCRVPRKHIESGFNLGTWLGYQRNRKDTLSEERRQHLEQLGIVWDAFEAAWEEGFSHLKTYRDREGHCQVPSGHIEKQFRLGQWVSVQRNREGKISNERKRRLNELGFIWEVRRTAGTEVGMNPQELDG